MAMARGMVRVTHRAMDDLHGIHEYSLVTFGEKVATRYLDDIEAALSRLESHPDILRTKQGVSRFFQFYAVGKHYLVCTRIEEVILVLCVMHCQMELIDRLATLEPTLEYEAGLLFKTLRRSL
jgi:plasmid stabilization system protein ParE